MTAPPGRRAIVIAFVVLEALAGLSWGVSAAGAVSAVVLAIAFVQITISGAVFMELWSAHPVHRVVAAVTVFFVALLCIGIAGDVSLRLSGP